MPPDATPQNGQYMVAAYVVTGAIYLLYALSLWIRARRALRGSDK
ncbi:MAG: hypothetical protein ABI679_05410 [Gemmatimonadota bacterium]